MRFFYCVNDISLKTNRFFFFLYTVYLFFCTVLFTENYLVFCYPDKPKMDYIYFMKKPDIIKKADKISTYDPRVGSICTWKKSIRIAQYVN